MNASNPAASSAQGVSILPQKCKGLGLRVCGLGFSAGLRFEAHIVVVEHSKQLAVLRSAVQQLQERAHQ